MRWKDKKVELEKYIQEGKSYEEIGRMYGCSGANIKKVAKRLGIELHQRRKINECETFNKGTAKTGICERCGKEYILYKGHRGHFCSHECYSEYKKEQKIEDWLNGVSNGCDVRYKLTNSIKEYVLNSKGNKCERCGFSAVNPYTGKSILQIHHIDGDASNTTPENLQVLCPNCHALTENFMSKNNKSARTYRREDYLRIENEIKKPL